MGPRHTDASMYIKKPTQCPASPNRSDSFSSSGEKFGVIFSHSAAVNNQVWRRFFHVQSRMANNTRDTLFFEPRRVVASRKIAAIDREAHTRQQKSQRAHTRSADTHEVDTFDSFVFRDFHLNILPRMPHIRTNAPKDFLHFLLVSSLPALYQRQK
jgi:hypothetical protein